MKKFSIILNILLLLICIFFVVYANVKFDVAKENVLKAEAGRLQVEKHSMLALEAAVRADAEAANLKMAELETQKNREELNKCKQSK